jgi:hypothetical protein
MKLRPPKLTHAIIFDLIGVATYLLPTVGEYADVLWAPLSAYLFYSMYGGKLGVFGALVSFLEEAFPFTDFVPTFTIGWIIYRLTIKKEIEEA